jgi:2-phospho-L-lactate guanylyltransferase
MTEIIIAVRGGRDAKSRCQGVQGLSGERLVEAMLTDMLDALTDLPCAAEITVVTPTPAIADLAWLHGASCLLQEAGGLDDAFELARRDICRRDPVMQVLFLLGDQPLLEPADVMRALSLHDRDGVVLVPSATDRGTAAIVVEARQPFAFSFGEGSFRRHLDAAGKLGLDARVLMAASLAQDIDRPEDLAAINRSQRRGHSWDLLQELSLPSEAVA